ncbi:hypothetical protein [Dehalobacterium formicoaceticum]|uniref:Bypass of forespore C C-terminal domain-containing protein n=1 Tax=Dehalobacterium formicoaceticum TaxID=51515 RepID=A0ABT1Y8K0_9FIRM|nr:hypothetical protein [Dehalobacterium formicoaceticum]MCR6546811.1 hypothetical protein [Dehalobacterium formicoaceticum]
MAFKHIKRMVGFCALAFVVSFAASFLFADHTFWHNESKKPLYGNSLRDNQTQTVGMIPENATIKEEIYYTQCQHLIQKEIIAGEAYPGMDEDALRAAGWALYHNNDREITIFKNIDGLCPKDEHKRHLGAVGEYVAVLKGPVGVTGELVEVLDIRIDRLPQEWQTKVKEGTLNFSSEQELLEAMDSIDEYE